LYSMSTCRYSRGVKQLLQEHGLPFEVREKDLDVEAYQELVRRTGQSMTPTLFFDSGDVLVDVDRLEVERYLRERGLLPAARS
jgi:glutaredoxin